MLVWVGADGPASLGVSPCPPASSAPLPPWVSPALSSPGPCFSDQGGRRELFVPCRPEGLLCAFAVTPLPRPRCPCLLESSGQATCVRLQVARQGRASACATCTEVTLGTIVTATSPSDVPAFLRSLLGGTWVQCQPFIAQGDVWTAVTGPSCVPGGHTL